jgi:hypothetical protein
MDPNPYISPPSPPLQQGVDVAQLVGNPGAALKIVGWLAIGVNLLIACVLPGMTHTPGPVRRPAGMDDETFEAHKAGAASAPFLDCCCISFSTLLVYPTVIVAGIRMQQLRNRVFAMVGACLAMLPCSPVMLLGVPIGIWSLIVLNDRDVVAAFAARKPGTLEGRDPT